MRKSLSAKMLALTLGSFLALIFGIMLFMYIYFNNFYQPQKINRMINAINAFSQAYEKRKWTNDKLYNEVSSFMKNQNATMSIMSYNQLNNNATLSIQPLQAIPASGVTIGSVGAIDHSDTVNLDSIKSVSASEPVYSLESTGKFEMATSTKINNTNIFFPVGVVAGKSTGKYVESQDREGVSYFISDMPYTDFKQVDFIKRISLGKDDVREIYVNLSLQSVEEIMDILKHIYLYLIIFAILLSLVIACVYSRSVTRPIIKITGVANRMAKMELDVKSDLSRGDELGNLSQSLNTLSSNLKDAMDGLMVANEQLKKDYENEVRQEIARKEFVANVSHEIKTPLGVIKSFSEGIRDGVKADKRDYYIEVILDEVDRMERMLLEMLEMSKLDAGVVVFDKQSVDVGQLIRKVKTYFSSSLAHKKLSMEIEGDFGTACIDSEKITRVLFNIIGNAIKYSNPYSVITIKCEKGVEQIKVMVENDCKPLTEESLGKIWERFYKVDVSHNREKEGAGLGLAIVKSILEGHGCDYGVENTNRGVRFYFVLQRV